MKKETKKKRNYVLNVLFSLVPAFAFIFLLCWAVKYDINNLVIPAGLSISKQLLNIIIWYTLISYSMNKLFEIWGENNV